MMQTRTYKIASEPDEFDQIHALNYKTFVEEIPQHASNNTRRLVDRFHNQNTYFICLVGTRLAAMIAMRAQRPFSLDEKVADLDSWLPADVSVCELRLLAIEPEFRCTRICADLLRFAAEECISQGYTLAVASGTIRQKRFYARMGFVPFARPVGSAEASYQPMYLTLQSALELFERLDAPLSEPHASISFLPGPVELSNPVRDALRQRPMSHRSEAFLTVIAEARRLLCSLTGAAQVELMLGSGTLANDVVAGQLSLLKGRGLLLSNGEFGERLIDHAERQELEFGILRVAWGLPHDIPAIERYLSEHAGIGWLWSTHCETSSGVLNDLDGLAEVCRRYGVKLCMDCTSSLGTVPLNLRSVYLATSVSGKGLASFAGIAMVFYNHEVTHDRRLPRYLDLGYYREKQGVPFTHSSNLLAALRQALHRLNAPARYDTIRNSHEWLRDQLKKSGLCIVAAEAHAAPAVLSLAIPPHLSSQYFGEEMERRGYLLSFRSSYLIEKNVVQICLMGDVTDADCRKMLEALVHVAEGQR